MNCTITALIRVILQKIFTSFYCILPTIYRILRLPIELISLDCWSVCMQSVAPFIWFKLMKACHTINFYISQQQIDNPSFSAKSRYRNPFQQKWAGVMSNPPPHTGQRCDNPSHSKWVGVTSLPHRPKGVTSHLLVFIRLQILHYQASPDWDRANFSNGEFQNNCSTFTKFWMNCTITAMGREKLH